MAHDIDSVTQHRLSSTFVKAEGGSDKRTAAIFQELSQVTKNYS